MVDIVSGVLQDGMVQHPGPADQVHTGDRSSGSPRCLRSTLG